MKGQTSQVWTMGKSFSSGSGSKPDDDSVDSQISLDILKASPSRLQSDHHHPALEANIPYMQHGYHDVEMYAGESSSAAERCMVPHEGMLEHSWRAFSRSHHKEQQGHLGLPEIPPNSVTGSSSNQRINRSFTPPSSSLISEALAHDLNGSDGFENVQEEGFLTNHTSTFRNNGTFDGKSEFGSPASLILSADCSGLVLDGSRNRASCSSDSLRMPYKRKALEDRMSQTFGNRGPGLSERAEASCRHTQKSPQVAASHISLPLHAENDLIPNNGLEPERPRTRIDVGRAFSANSPFLNTSECAETSSSNLLQGTDGFNQQEQRYGSNFLTRVDVGMVDGSSSSQQSSRLLHPNYLYDMNPYVGLESGGHHEYPNLQAPPFHRINQSRWNARSSRASSSSCGRDDAASAERTQRSVSVNLSEQPLPLPAEVFGSIPDYSVNWNSTIGNICPGGHGASTSTPGSSRITRLSSPGRSLRSGTWYHQRSSEMMRRSLFPSVGSGSGPLSSNHVVRANNQYSIALPAVPDNCRQNRASTRSSQVELHLPGGLEVPHSLRTLAAASGERRRSMVTEIRHVFDLMRRGESLRFEDMVFLDHSGLIGMTDIHDRHRDLRMDVDSMSYEELLALEERMGTVCTGLTEDAIGKHLKRRRYHHHVENEKEAQEDNCCICREEYVAGEDIGELTCGHDFHALCIKQWLLLKNLCPICKTTGLLNS